MRNAVRFRVALLGADGAGAPSSSGSGSVGDGAEHGGGAPHETPGRQGPGVLLAAVPAEEEVVAAEYDILDAELELEAYICKVHVRMPSLLLHGPHSSCLSLCHGRAVSRLWCSGGRADVPKAAASAFYFRQSMSTAARLQSCTHRGTTRRRCARRWWTRARPPCTTRAA